MKEFIIICIVDNFHSPMKNKIIARRNWRMFLEKYFKNTKFRNVLLIFLATHYLEEADMFRPYSEVIEDMYFWWIDESDFFRVKGIRLILWNKFYWLKWIYFETNIYTKYRLNMQKPIATLLDICYSRKCSS